MNDLSPSPLPSEGNKEDTRDLTVRVLRVAQAAATAVEIWGKASNNEALTWIARASRVLLGGAVGYLTGRRRPQK